MKLEAKRGFFDKQANKYRPSGEVFEVPEKRAREILSAGVAVIVGEDEKEARAAQGEKERGGGKTKEE